MGLMSKRDIHTPTLARTDAHAGDADRAERAEELCRGGGARVQCGQLCAEHVALLQHAQHNFRAEGAVRFVGAVREEGCRGDKGEVHAELVEADGRGGRCQAVAPGPQRPVLVLLHRDRDGHVLAPPALAPAQVHVGALRNGEAIVLVVQRLAGAWVVRETELNVSKAVHRALAVLAAHSLLCKVRDCAVDRIVVGPGLVEVELEVQQRTRDRALGMHVHLALLLAVRLHAHTDARVLAFRTLAHLPQKRVHAPRAPLRTRLYARARILRAYAARGLAPARRRELHL